MDGRKGTYALVLTATADFSVDIGRLGKIEATAGFYIYLGSAFGPGGISARLKHHFQTGTTPHWHIDYFKRHCAIGEVWFSYDTENREHAWTETLLTFQETGIPFPGFGSSDCQCRSHLVYMPVKPSIQRFRRQLHRSIPGHAAVKLFRPTA